MKGKNQIIMCQAEMVRAVQYYLNEVQFKKPVLVAGITEDKSKRTFIVSIEEGTADEVGQHSKFHTDGDCLSAQNEWQLSSV